MPQPVNETIGQCPCSNEFCSETADVRRQKNHPKGRLYLHCPACHTIRLTGAPFQEYIKANAQLFGADPKPAPAPKPAPVAETVETVAAPAPKPAPAPVAKPPAPEAAPSETKAARGGWNDWDIEDI